MREALQAIQTSLTGDLDEIRYGIYNRLDDINELADSDEEKRYKEEILERVGWLVEIIQKARTAISAVNLELDDNSVFRFGRGKAMKAVWIVEEGEYSDYKVSAICVTKEIAQKYLDKYPGGVVTERKLFESSMELPEKKIFYYVTMRKDGTTISDICEWLLFEDEVNVGFQHFNDSIFEDPISWIVQTDNGKTAIKVVNEKRIQILALRLWGKNAEVRELFRQESMNDKS